MATRKSNLPKKGSRISRVEAERFLELYNRLGTYEAVAKIVGRSPSAVSNWVKRLQAEATIYTKPNSAIPVIIVQQEKQQA